MIKIKTIIFLLIRKLIYISLGSTDQFLGRKSNIVILCYHSISNNNWIFNTKLSDLDKQMKYMISKYNPISLEDLYMYLAGNKAIRRPSFVINFDDGYKNITSSIKLFKKYNIKPTVFLVADSLKVDREELRNNYPFLSADNIKNLRSNGWEFGSHGLTHRAFNRCNNRDILKEIKESKQLLQKRIGCKVDYISYPFGLYSEKVLKVVKNSGYKLGLTMNDQFFTSSINTCEVPRIGVNASHSISEFKYLSSPSVIWFRGFIKKYI